MADSSKVSEADLCAAFIAEATASGEWVAYPETAGFDIVLVRKADGIQIGIEAKLTLNAKVLSQVMPYLSSWDAAENGPDYRAVLVPAGKGGDLTSICGALGVTVMRWYEACDYGGRAQFTPELPHQRHSSGDWHWHQWAPMTRCEIPDWVPDVSAGCSAPLALTVWKVKAIKLRILMEDRPVTRADFKALQLSPSRWTDPFSQWLTRSPDGRGYVPGPRIPDFEAQHPRNYAEIKADRAKWDLPFKPDVGTAPLPGLFDSKGA